MKPGLYALASFDGAPLAPEDKDALGFVESQASAWHALAGITVCAVDDMPAEKAVSVVREADSLMAFLGYLDEQDELAAQLGLPRDTAPAALARVAVERLGADAPAAMLGQWSFLHWDARARALTVLGSENFRDSLFYTTDGKRFALAPDMLRLTRLPWVGRRLDPEGLALRLSRAGLRRITGRRTVWQGISRALPAVRDIFTLGRHTEVAPAPRPGPVLWRGSFEEAVDALNALGRRIVGQEMRRYERNAFLLSGGLDSTLLTALGAQGRGDGADMFCLTSVAPDGSGLLDERQFSQAVAQSLGVSLRLISPAPDASIYWPSPKLFERTGEPSTSPRHYLYDAFFHAARAGGANAVFDGQFGELSITIPPDTDEGIGWPRNMLYALRAWQHRRKGREWPQEAFHVLFSRDFLAALPQDWEAPWREGPEQPPRQSPQDPLGFHPAMKKGAGVGGFALPGLRHFWPYRDQRLLRFAAGLPLAFMYQGGATRAVGRDMLRGKVPDSVRLRTAGMPISPDYENRARQQAREARKRIATYRECGVTEWLDLDVLENSLKRIEQGSSVYSHAENQSQLSCMAAEFLVWDVSLSARKPNSAG